MSRLLLLLLCLSGVVVSEQYWQQSGHFLYHFEARKPATAAVARRACHKVGGELLFFDSDRELYAVGRLYADRKPFYFWTDAYWDSDAEMWLWKSKADDEDDLSSNILQMQDMLGESTDGDCAKLDIKSLEIKPRRCRAHLPYICKRPAKKHETKHKKKKKHHSTMKNKSGHSKKNSKKSHHSMMKNKSGHSKKNSKKSHHSMKKNKSGHSKKNSKKSHHSMTKNKSGHSKKNSKKSHHSTIKHKKKENKNTKTKAHPKSKHVKKKNKKHEKVHSRRRLLKPKEGDPGVGNTQESLPEKEDKADNQIIPFRGDTVQHFDKRKKHKHKNEHRNKKPSQTKHHYIDDDAIVKLNTSDVNGGEYKKVWPSLSPATQRDLLLLLAMVVVSIAALIVLLVVACMQCARQRRLRNFNRRPYFGRKVIDAEESLSLAANWA